MRGLIDSIEREDFIQVIKGNHEDQEENAKKNLEYGKLVAFIIGNKNGTTWSVSCLPTKSMWRWDYSGEDKTCLIL